jgi:type III restriction enzyme
MQLTLKLDFKQSDLYQSGVVFFNKKVPKNFSDIQSFEDFGLKKTDFRFTLSSGIGRMSSALNFEIEKSISNDEVLKQKSISLEEIPFHIIHFALTKNPFFRFDKLKIYFPNLKSIREFTEKEAYLGGLKITFIGTTSRLSEITFDDYLFALQALLQQLESEIKGNSTEFEGSDYVQEYVHKVFKDKPVRINKYDERANGQEALVANEPWYAYNANYGTSEEKKFVELFAKRFESLNQKFENIYLLRNERELKIYDKLGRAFEPDFVLFCKQKESEQLTFQVFIEPKGNGFIANDKWKEEFLKDIQRSKKTISIQTDSYLITAVPFYNYSNENEFEKELENTLILNK